MYLETSSRDGNFGAVSEKDVRIVPLTVVSSPADLIAQLVCGGSGNMKPQSKDIELKRSDGMTDVVRRALFVEGDENALARASVHSGGDAGASSYIGDGAGAGAGAGTGTASVTDMGSDVRASIDSGGAGTVDAAGDNAVGESVADIDSANTRDVEVEMEIKIESDVVCNDEQAETMLAVVREITRSRDVRYQLRSAGCNKDANLLIRSGVQKAVLKRFGMADNPTNIARLRRAAVQFPKFGLGVQL